MNVAVATPPPPVIGQPNLRVMVVDDAIVVRGLIARWIDSETGLQVVASLRSGREAIEQVEPTDPDVVILDVDMPDTDGITALPRLLAKKRDLVVLMLSTLTRRNAEISLRALSLGAADYIPKPESNREFTTSQSFQRELIDKIRALGARRKRGVIAPRVIAASPAVGPARPDPRGRAGRAAAEPRARPAGAGKDPVAAVSGDYAAGAVDWRLDRRTAGAQYDSRRDRSGHRPGSGPHHPAYAAHVHRHSGRTPHADQWAPGRRGGGWRARARRPHLRGPR